MAQKNPDKKQQHNLLLIQAEAVELLGITPPTLLRWHAEMPGGGPPRRPDKKYELRALGEWIREEVTRSFTGGDNTKKFDPAQERARKDAALADKAEFENKIRDSQYIEFDKVKNAAEEMILKTRQRLLGVGASLGQTLAIEEDPINIQTEIEDAIRDALTELSDEWVLDEDEE